jgi:hypothetical protein
VQTKIVVLRTAQVETLDGGNAQRKDIPAVGLGFKYAKQYSSNFEREAIHRTRYVMDPQSLIT